MTDRSSASPKPKRIQRKRTKGWKMPDSEEVVLHASYRLAVRDVQGRGQTDKRPTKLRAGWYELKKLYRQEVLDCVEAFDAARFSTVDDASL